VGRTLLSAAFDVDLSLKFAAGLCGHCGPE
jgi:hypothetical protein